MNTRSKKSLSSNIDSSVSQSKCCDYASRKQLNKLENIKSSKDFRILTNDCVIDPHFSDSHSHHELREKDNSTPSLGGCSVEIEPRIEENVAFEEIKEEIFEDSAAFSKLLGKNLPCLKKKNVIGFSNSVKINNHVSNFRKPQNRDDYELKKCSKNSLGPNQKKKDCALKLNDVASVLQSEEINTSNSIILKSHSLMNENKSTKNKVDKKSFGNKFLNFGGTVSKNIVNGKVKSIKKSKKDDTSSASEEEDWEEVDEFAEILGADIENVDNTIKIQLESNSLCFNRKRKRCRRSDQELVSTIK